MNENETTALVARSQLTPDIWNMLVQVGKAVHMSRKFGVTSEQEATIKLLFCLENGLPLSTANTGLYIVNGRMAVESNVIAAQLRRHPDYDYKVTKLDNDGCIVQILRRQDGKWVVEGEASWTKEDTKLAELDTKDNHRAYPSDMSFARAISRAYKRYAPNIFLGGPVYTPEDLKGSVVEGTWQPVEQSAAAPTVEAAPVAEVPAHAGTLNDLVTRFGAEAIMTANGGRIPGTEQELQAVSVKLEEGAETQGQSRDGRDHQSRRELNTECLTSTT